MGGGKKLISALLAAAMVGQMGLMVGMADPTQNGCGLSDHGLKDKSAKDTQPCDGGGPGMHWVSITENYSPIGGIQSSKYTYFYPKVSNANVICYSGAHDIIILEDALFQKPDSPVITVENYDPDEDKIMIPYESSLDEASSYGTELFIFDSSKTKTVSVKVKLLEGASGSVSANKMPKTEPWLSFNKATGELTVTSGEGYSGDYTFLKVTEEGDSYLVHEVITKPENGENNKRTLPPSNADGSYIAVENGTGQKTAKFTVACAAQPTLTSDPALRSGEAAQPGSYKLDVTYPGECTLHEPGSDHGYGAVDWATVTGLVPGVTVDKEGNLTIDGNNLEPGTRDVTISAANHGSISFQVKGALKMSTNIPPSIQITKDETYDCTTNIPSGQSYGFLWELSQTVDYIQVSPTDQATAKVNIIKDNVPETGVPETPFTLKVTATPPARSIQAKAIAAFAVTPIAGTQEETLTAEFTFKVTAAAEPGGGSTGTGGDSTGTGGDSTGSDNGTTDPDTPGTPNDPPNSSSPSAPTKPEIEIKSSNPTPNAITITGSSAAKVSYDYNAVPPEGKEEDYDFQWTLTNKDYPKGPPDFIDITFKGARATVTVIKAKLPDKGVNTTFDLTVVLTPKGAAAPAGLTIAPLAATTAAGTLTKTFSIKVYAAKKAAASTGSPDSSDSIDRANHVQWLDVEQDIEEARKGSTVKVSLKDNVHMPFYVFDALKGRDVSLQMKISGGYTWTVNGRSVQKLPGNQVWVSLGVETYSGSKLTSLCRDSKIKSFQLENDGSFYGDMRLTVNLGSSYAKKTVYLYSYDEAKNKLTYSSSAKAADNGDVEFVFTRSLGAYAITSKALYGESAVTTGGGAVGSGNRPTAVYPPEVTAAPYQPPASEASSGSGSSQSEPDSSREPSSAPDTTPVDVVVQPEPEPEPDSVPIIVPLLILAIAGVIAATVVVINNSRSRGSFDF